MDPETIIADILAGEQLIATAINTYNTVKADLSPETQAQIEAQIASSGANLDAARKTLDADAAA